MKLTAEQRAVFVAAIEVAIYPPFKPNENVWAAKVKWKAITELRDALDAAGIDWRHAKEQEDELLRQADARMNERRRAENTERVDT